MALDFLSLRFIIASIIETACIRVKMITVRLRFSSFATGFSTGFLSVTLCLSGTVFVETGLVVAVISEITFFSKNLFGGISPSLLRCFFSNTGCSPHATCRDSKEVGYHRLVVFFGELLHCFMQKILRLRSLWGRLGMRK